MKSKWFKITGNRFKSKKKAKTLTEAWDKTIKKWGFLMQGYNSHQHTTNCGLCNLYRDNDCQNCPIRQITDNIYCMNTPIDDWSVNGDIEHAFLEYLFLLIVREATK